MRNLLFTTSNCPKCPATKDLLIAKNFEFEHIDASTKEGLDLARKYGVGAVPTLVVVDENGERKDSAHGIDEIEKLVDEN
jgi:glutaredoxin